MLLRFGVPKHIWILWVLISPSFSQIITWWMWPPPVQDLLGGMVGWGKMVSLKDLIVSYYLTNLLTLFPGIEFGPIDVEYLIISLSFLTG